MSREARKLTVYFGERDRAGGRFLADRLIGIFAAHGLAVSLLIRGVEGFGVKHGLRTDRLLTLSEDLPLVAVAVDEPRRIASVLGEVEAIGFGGLITVERALLGDGGSPRTLPELPGDEVKLTVYLGRGRRIDGRPTYERAVRILRERGVAGASVLVGVDGTIRGARRRAGFFSRNADVPVMVISVGERDRIAAALAELGSLPGEMVTTLERVQVLKRDGARLADLGAAPEPDPEGLERWVKLMLYSGELNRAGGVPAHVAAVRQLRAQGAPGATALRGIWGYHGEHPPHGEELWRVRRRVPTLTAVIDRPARAREWLGVLDQLAPRRGLITAEIVPAFRARGPGISCGGLRLAAPASARRPRSP